MSGSVRCLCFSLSLLLMGLWSFSVRAERAVSAKPNIVFIMADDLGNADLGYRGGEVVTPNIDQLAKAGVRMESFYGQQVCTPARAALMTGRYPMRQGLQTLVIFPSHTYGLPTDEWTLPQALKAAGYQTYMVGKWHLGHADSKYWPQNRGFDYFYGNTLGEVNYFTKERGGVIDWQRNGTFLQESGYYTDLIADDAVRLIEQQDPKKPFFLYFASLAPHAPFEVPDADLKQYAGIQDKSRQAYSAMISNLDRAIGRVVAALEKKGLRDNTLILFASDNGGATSGLFATGAKSPSELAKESGSIERGARAPANNAPFRGGKGGLYEGGVRVPAFANWPARLKPAVVNAPLHMVDIMPTALALAGGRADAGHPLDGRNIWPVLSGGKANPDETILVNVEAFRGAVRRGDWKLVKLALLPGKVELFDLLHDPGEKNNVAEKHPEIVKDLEARLVAYAKEQKPSEWIKAQPLFVGDQGKTVFDADFDIDDHGLPHEKAVMPGK